MSPPPPTSPAPHGDWDLTPLGRDSWRICDPSRRQGDAECLIAYVERNDTGTLDVLWLRRPCPRRSRFHDFADLFSELDAAVAAASDRSRPPVTIPHMPPL
ncbi:hypothetical protein [Microbacterium sp. EF45047]|uniref:hypothetical protein n=1 Tax=Microbacterium sp. EF45047 TaxID=2809708 RepID=UPI002349FAAE|nr:hypothetical protein [Microbacterium sp. EF45047]WCM55401.1 hypothetical protein JRG78_10700 [Microbacterium sp. EF45047]